MKVLGPGAWHPLDPSWVPLPVTGAGKIYWGHGVRGLASPDPLLGAIPWCAAPQVEVIQHVPIAGDQIVVCQCHRSCRYVEVASLCGDPQLQFSDKAVDMPVASNARCLGLSVQKTVEFPQLQYSDTEVDVPVVLPAGCPVQFIDGMDVAVIMQRLWVSCWRCLKFSSPPESVDPPVCSETGGFQRGIGGDVGLGIFRVPPGRPGVERQFSEPSMMKSSS